MGSIIFFYWNNIFANDILNFSEYMAQDKKIENISRTKILYKIKQAKTMECTYVQEKKDTYIISPSCIIKNKLPQMGFVESIDYLRPYIQWFNNIYNDTSTNFSYEWTTPIFQKNYEIVPPTIEEKYALVVLQEQEKKLRIHKSSIAYQTLKNANFFAVYKDTSLLKNCTKKNYTVALRKINGMLLFSGKTLNLNKKIMNLSGYCKWSGPQNLLFYGGVCGFATQLFRASLLVPTIEITKRYGHNERLVPYYYDYIFWDDAALYEMSKQLEIKNNGPRSIYLKVLEWNKWNYFVIITPEKDDRGVTIKKQQTKTLGAKVDREIYKKSPDMVLQRNTFTSNYIKKTYTTR